MGSRSVFYQLFGDKMRAPMKWLMFVYIIVVSHLVSNAQTADIEAKLTEEEIAWIAEHPVIRATNEMDWAPIDFVQDGNAVGFSVDYLNLIARKTGLKIEYVSGYSWEGLLELLRNRELDVAQSVTFAPQFEEFLEYTDPYLGIPQVFFGRIGEDRINSSEDLLGKRIGVIREWADTYEIREKFPHLNFTDFQSNNDALLALSIGEIDLFTMKLPAGNYINCT